MRLAGRPTAAMLLCGLAAASLFVATTVSPAAYIDGPPPAHTGGFGEPTCHACHFDGPVDDPAGGLALEDVPVAYEPGRGYLIRVVLTRPEMARGGFEMAARFAEGERAGAAAGSLRGVDARVEVTRVDSSGVAYAHHTEAGSALANPGTAEWTVEWTAPDAVAGPVIFHVAANAANDDLSAFGDHIYTASAVSRPAIGT